MADPPIPIAGRYSFGGALKSSQALERWIGVEQDQGRRVVLAVADAGRLTTLDAARGVKHRHLTSVLEIARDVDARSLPSGQALQAGFGVAVAEFVPGTTLHSELARRAMHPSKAVAWILRLADAVQALHSAGAVHGALSPRAVIAVPAGRAIAPVLSQLVAPAIGAYCPPERLRGAAETSPDDVWALHATLYAALTRQAPFSAAVREALLKQMLGRPQPLSAFGIDEPALQEILDRGLAYEKRARVTELSELISTLDGWERDARVMPPKRQLPPRPPSRGLIAIIGASGGKEREDGIVIDSATLPEDEGSELDLKQFVAGPSLSAARPPVASLVAPPAAVAKRPLASFASLTSAPAGIGASAHPTASVSPLLGVTAVASPIRRKISINPFERKSSVWPLVLVAAIVGGAGVYVAVAPDAAPPPPKEAPIPAAVLPKVVQPREQPKLSPSERRDTCVASYFDPATFDVAQNFAFVCADGDFRQIALRLQHRARSTAARAGDGGSAPDAARVDASARASGLDWYELPATAIIRKACCESATPVTLPETPGWCEQLQTVVRRIADDSAKSGDLAPAARTFDRAVACLFANRVTKVYAYEKPPTEANRQAFQQFLGRAAISEARR